ncbi:hypothetical protein BKA59DRAFT_505866 [Fusarium tricinctum]|uniref:Uncharacterized protein n=1 Tax=Fusarium tricinctum TaxID=61284 RepID=A0A8K0WID8_9HYPO|nr:hypothetical protein BKA59DRAFT_505866 [Fusarium tricinctum]
MSVVKRLLLFTNSDYGQANVVLATAHALGLASQDVEIHIASFQDLQDGVNDASRFMQAEAARKKLTVPKSTEIRKTAEQVASRHPEWLGRQKAAQEILDYLIRED